MQPTSAEFWGERAKGQFHLIAVVRWSAMSTSRVALRALEGTPARDGSCAALRIILLFFLFFPGIGTLVKAPNTRQATPKRTPHSSHNHCGKSKAPKRVHFAVRVCVAWRHRALPVPHELSWAHSASRERAQSERAADPRPLEGKACLPSPPLGSGVSRPHHQEENASKQKASSASRENLV
jgi:ribosomal protein S30